MGRKIIEIPYENTRILVVLGADPPRAIAENEIKLPLSMGGKSLKFFRKITDSRGPGG